MKKNMLTTGLFPESYRASGVVLDVAALPSPYGIGDVGPRALSWVDRLRDAGQSWWQAIQLEGTQGFNSGSHSLSSLGFNELLISPDWLIEDGLLGPRDCECVTFPQGSIDYDVVVPFKHWLLEKAWTRFNRGARKDLLASYEQFRKKQKHWLEDYALFRALKMKYKGASYTEWPADLARRNQSALAEARRELTSQIDQVRFSQFLLARQVKRLKEYANNKGVRLIGDSPFLISADSSEAWAYPELFVRDEKRESGDTLNLVPFCFSSGEGFSANDRVARSRVSYRWCVDRLRDLLTQVDIARVNIRGLGAPRPTAGGAPADRRSEDLDDRIFMGASALIGDVRALDRTGARGSRDEFQALEIPLLQLAMDGSSDKSNFAGKRDSVVYTGLPSGESTREWFNQLPDNQQRALWAYLKRPQGESSEVAWELIRLAWSSMSPLAMVSFGDLLNLEGDQAREEGDGNFGHKRWRCREEMLSAPGFYWLRELTRATNRSADLKKHPPRPVLRRARTQARISAAVL